LVLACSPEPSIFYIHPGASIIDPELNFSETEFEPRLFFFDRDIWETAFKLKMQIDNSSKPGYPEALNVVLAHGLVRLR
jgi:AraC family transcriptional regulator